MSQDQPAMQGQRNPNNEAAPSSSRGVFTPNMQPFIPMGADPFSTTPYSVSVFPIPRSTQDFLRHPPLNYAPKFADFGDSYLGQLQDMHPHVAWSRQAQLTSHDNEKPRSRAQFKSPNEHHPQPVAYPLWPTYAPGQALPPSHMYSRLPPSDIGRKAPRKLDASSPAQPSSSQLADSTPKSTQRRVTKQQHRQQQGNPLASHSTPIAKNSTTRATKPASSADRTTIHDPVIVFKRSTPTKKPTRLHHTPAQSRPAVVLHDEDESDDDDLPLRAICQAKNAGTPVGRTKTTTTTKNANTENRCSIRRPQTQFEYGVPGELESIHKALGEDNWTDFIILVEKKYLKQITDAEFAAKSKRIFMTFDDKVRVIIESKIAKLMVLPAIQQQKETMKH
jgi:hypothetical protein